jgi:FAD/FMN-containing dehydrogenase/Fe-S oxidoreductase
MSLPRDFSAELRKHFTGEIREDLASRVLYSTDASIYQIEPLAVAIPRTQEDVHAAVELSAKYRVPILARGAGSSLAGQAIGRALILDCSRWLDKIVAINAEERWAKVEPGVILESLNREAERHGLRFGPDPASAERATMGGVIANNATGAHSIQYGMTADHLRSARVILADGTLATLGEVRVQPAESEESVERRTPRRPREYAASERYAAILAAALEIRERYADAIRARYPATWRNSAGYRLNYLLPWSRTSPPEWSGGVYPAYMEPRTLNLAHLLAGSEGTLAVVSQATVGLVPKPKFAVLGLLAYSSIEAACDAVPTLMDSHPSAIELIPRTIMQMAQAITGYAHQIDWIRGDPAALLVVEFSGEYLGALRSSAEALGRNVVVAESPEAQASVWNLRKVGLGILDSRPRAARPIAFIEDCAIPVDQLGAFVREVQRIMAEHNAEGGIYGHASAGCLHIRPVLDLKTPGGVRALRSIAEQTLRLALRLGGSMASEHGDGLARGEWIRQTYGDDVSKAMRMLKNAADPEGLLNPGKILDAPAMDSNLRYGPDYRAHEWAPGLDFDANGGLAMAIEQCNGQGVCRKETGLMCPSFQATRDEMYSTRGRANLLRALITNRWQYRAGLPSETGANSTSASSSDVHKELMNAAFQALDLCLACKACKAECPSGVDMAKLKSTFQEEYYRTHSRPIRDYVFGYFHVTARIASRFGPFLDAASDIALVRRVAAHALGLTPRRPFPKFAGKRARLRERPDQKPVLFLPDTFNHYIDSPVEQAAFDLLSAAGYRVRVLDTMGAGAALVSKGFLSGARRHAQSLLDEVQRKDPDGSTPLLAIEPSEISSLRSDYGELLPDCPSPLLRRVADVRAVDEFLASSGAIREIRVATNIKRILLHPHCHEKTDNHSHHHAPTPPYASADLLRACGYEVETIDAGCCGMAGTFGYEAEHFDLSQAVGELRLLRRIRESKGVPIAATGAACRLQIEQGTEAVVAHPLVWAVQALRPS